MSPPIPTRLSASSASCYRPRDHGLALAQGTGLAYIKHTGGRSLPLPAACFTCACRAMVTALNEAIHKFGAPEIMNTSSRDVYCENTLPRNGSGTPVHIIRLDGSVVTIQCSHLNGRQGPVPLSGSSYGQPCRAVDQYLCGMALAIPENECVYLHAWGTGSEAKAGVGK